MNSASRMGATSERKASILRNYCKLHSMPSSVASDLSAQPLPSVRGMLDLLVRHQSSVAKNGLLLVKALKG